MEIHMELTLLSDSKLKVRLSREELVGFSLTCDTLDYDNTETKYALWSILKEAKTQTGFDTAKERLYIRVYPQPGGGCDMFVSKIKERLSETTALPAPQKSSENTEIAAMPLSAEKNPPGNLYTVSKLVLSGQIYEFSKLSNLLEVCRKLCDSELSESFSSSVYYEKSSGRYYLIISLCSPETDIPESSANNLKLAFICEYGTPCVSDNAEHKNILCPVHGAFGSCYSYIIEHCTPVCTENAVMVLSEFASVT